MVYKLVNFFVYSSGVSWNKILILLDFANDDDQNLHLYILILYLLDDKLKKWGEGDDESLCLLRRSQKGEILSHYYRVPSTGIHKIYTP